MPYKQMVKEKTLTKEEYEQLKPLEYKYKGFHMDGSINLSETEKDKFRHIFKRLEGYDFCNSCPSDVQYAFTRVFKAFYFTDFKEEKPLLCEEVKPKRKRL
jgi:hypothetical protein